MNLDEARQLVEAARADVRTGDIVLVCFYRAPTAGLEAWVDTSTGRVVSSDGSGGTHLLRIQLRDNSMVHLARAYRHAPLGAWDVTTADWDGEPYALVWKAVG